MFSLGDDDIDAIELLGAVSALSRPARRLLRLSVQTPDSALLTLGAEPERILIERWPAVQALKQATEAGHRFGVYLPSDAPHPTNRLGLPTDRSAALDRLRRLALTLGAAHPFVLADADTIADALHYAELVAPHAAQLLLLGGTVEQRARIRQAFAQAKSGH